MPGYSPLHLCTRGICPGGRCEHRRTPHASDARACRYGGACRGKARRAARQYGAGRRGGRGCIVPRSDAGPLGAAACDVLAHEPPAPGLPLLRLPNFLATPHLGAATDEALLRVGMCVVEQILTVLDGKTPAHECIGTTDRTDVESEHK